MNVMIFTSVNVDYTIALYIYNIHIIYGKKHTYTDTFTAHAIDIP